MKRSRLYFLLGIFIIPLVLIFSQCFHSGTNLDARGDEYAGSKTCQSCHKDIFTSNIHTAHFLASQPANRQTVGGNFHTDSNTFKVTTQVFIRMEKHGDAFYQTAYIKGRKDRSERLAIVFGGVKGESYLYSRGSRYFQLPVSYASRLHRWTSSPGYASGELDFDRAIGRRCFECHSSYIKEIPGRNSVATDGFSFEKNSVVYGIDCERCHGPAAKHVSFHRINPAIKTAHFISRYALLSRAQKLDACAVCHSGNTATLLRSTFSFLPGDSLSNYTTPGLYSSSTSTEPDVHSNQLQLLSLSACFIHSKMDCGTCHDPHKNQRNQSVVFAEACLNCHSGQEKKLCKMHSVLNADVLKINCIQCHMPAKPSKAIATQTSGGDKIVPYKVVTHHIKVYPQEAARILNYLNRKK